MKAPGRSRKSRSRRAAPTFDAFGGGDDGSLAIIGDDGAIVHRAPRRVTSALRYYLALAESDHDLLPSRIAVLSAVRGEGVTYISRSLAAVLAYDTDRSVVHVDLNWQQPRGEASGNDSENQGTEQGSDAPKARNASAKSKRSVKNNAKSAAGADSAGESAVADNVVKVPARPTLADLVEHDASAAKVATPTANPRLSMVRGGQLSIARRPAVASSSALEAALGKIASDFDHVVFDLPPVLRSSDAIRLTNYADAFILVVRQGRTPTSQIEATLDELKGQRSLGVILNRSTSKIPTWLRRMLGA